MKELTDHADRGNNNSLIGHFSVLFEKILLSVN